jgi:hypothetical protein
MRSVSSLAVVSLVSALVACAPEGSSAYVSFNVPPDESCLVQPSSDIFIASGLWDIGRTNAANDFCKRPYFLHLIVNSSLKANARDSTGRAEPNVLQITEADVRLLDEEKNTIHFKVKKGDTADDPARPNPFRVQTANSLPPSSGRDPSKGVVSIEAIPKAYADKLTDFVSHKVLVEVQIFGTTTGDVDIDFKPFVFPVSICRGCLSICQTTVTATGADLIGTGCNDNGAQDGRYCVDPNEGCVDTEP